MTGDSSCPDADEPLPMGVASDVASSAEYAVQANSSTGMNYRITKSAGEYERTCGMGGIASPLVPPAGSDAGCASGSG